MANTGSMIVGGALAVVGAILTFVVPGAGPVVTKIGISLMISGSLSVISAAFAPKPTGGGGIESSTTYGSNLRAVAAEGAPKKIILGKMRIQPDIISMRTESTGETETVFLLGHVGSGGDYGIESITDPELNDNPLEHFGDAVEFDTRLGTDTQTVMEGFDKTSVAYPVNEDIPNTAWDYVTKGEVEEVSVVLVWYAGLFKLGKGGIETATWMADVEYQNDGESTWTRINAPSGVSDGWGTVWLGQGWQCSGRSTSAVRRVMNLVFPDKQKRTIRINPYKSYTDNYYKRQATIDRIEEIVNDDEAYPGNALIGLKYVVNEQLAGGLPKFTCVAKGWKVQNLGDSSPAWTQNPAKLLHAFLLNEKDGCGRYISSDMLDDAPGGSWRAAESYFDEQVTVNVDVGKTRQEDRTHLDLVIDTMNSPEEWIAHIEALTRSRMVDWGVEGIRLLTDKPSSSVATFDGRQIPGAGNRPILRLEDGRLDLVEHEIVSDQRTTHLRGVYWDVDENYSRRYTDELVDPDYIDGDPRVYVELAMPGVVRESQSLRQCRYRLNVDRLRTKVYEWGVGVGDLNLVPMDVVTVFADSPPLNGVEMMVLATTYGNLGNGRVSAVLYDEDVYLDTSDTLQKRDPFLSREDALGEANKIPAGATSLTLSEIVGSTHIEASWSVVKDINRRSLRVYVSRSAKLKGTLLAELDPDETSYVIRNVQEALWYVRVLAVGRGQLEESVTVGASASIQITRQKKKPLPVANPIVRNAADGMKKVVGVDPPDQDDQPQKVEVIRGPDAERGQLLGTVPVERAGTIGEQGVREPTITLPSLPGRRAGSEGVHVRAVTPEGKRGGDAAEVQIPFTDMPGRKPTDLASIIGDQNINFVAPGGGDPWVLDPTNGAMMTEVSPGRYHPAMTVTTVPLDLGAPTTFALETYDEFFRLNREADVVLEDATFPAFPSDNQTETFPPGIDWAARLLDDQLRPVRPLAPVFWEVRHSLVPLTTEPWEPMVPFGIFHAQYLEVRVTAADELTLFRLHSEQILVRAWVEETAGRETGHTPGDLIIPPTLDVVLVDATATVTLPDAAANENRLIDVKSAADGAIVTLVSVAGAIDGQAEQIIFPHEGITAISDGTDWWIL